jgi:hypothetical protein
MSTCVSRGPLMRLQVGAWRFLRYMRAAVAWPEESGRLKTSNRATDPSASLLVSRGGWKRNHQGSNPLAIPLSFLRIKV